MAERTGDCSKFPYGAIFIQLNAFFLWILCSLPCMKINKWSIRPEFHAVPRRKGSHWGGWELGSICRRSPARPGSAQDGAFLLVAALLKVWQLCVALKCFLSACRVDFLKGGSLPLRCCHQVLWVLCVKATVRLVWWAMGWGEQRRRSSQMALKHPALSIRPASRW